MIAGYLFLLPNLFGFLLFSVFPILAALYLTFTDWDLGGTPEFVGLDNFARMARDEIFWKALFNTFYYAFVAVPTGVFFAFWLALLINRKIRGILTFRLIYFLPHLTLTVAAAIVWAWIYHPGIRSDQLFARPGRDSGAELAVQQHMGHAGPSSS